MLHLYFVFWWQGNNKVISLDGSKFPWNGKAILGICHDSSFEIIFEKNSRIVIISIYILKSPECSYGLLLLLLWTHLFNHLSQYNCDLFVHSHNDRNWCRNNYHTEIASKLIKHGTLKCKDWFFLLIIDLKFPFCGCYIELYI